MIQLLILDNMLGVIQCDKHLTPLASCQRSCWYKYHWWFAANILHITFIFAPRSLCSIIVSVASNVCFSDLSNCTLENIFALHVISYILAYLEFLWLWNKKIPDLLMFLIFTLLFGTVENTCSSCMCQNNLFAIVALI